MEEKFKTLEITQKNADLPIFHVQLNRPSQRNALTLDFFTELPRALSLLDHNHNAAVIVISGRGPHFCAGIDLSALQSLAGDNLSDPSRRREHLRRQILSLQSAISAIERCRRPVIAAVNGACIGAGVDLVTACDLRYCTDDAFFSVKEVDLAIAADLGTLQRLPSIIGRGSATEMALTGKKITASEAKSLGLVSAVFASRELMDIGVEKIARDIAGKSPVAVAGTKAVLLKSRDLTVEQGLDYVATWNSAMLMSDDLEEAVKAQLQKRKPAFCKL